MFILHQNSAGDVHRTGSRSKYRDDRDGEDLHSDLQDRQATSGDSVEKDGNRNQGNLMQGVEKPMKKGQKLGVYFINRVTDFRSPELKAQVSFSDQLSSVVCLSVRPSVCPSVCL